MSCCNGGYVYGYPSTWSPYGYPVGGFFTGVNNCTGLYGGWGGGGWSNWNLYGSPCLGFRGCNSFAYPAGDGNGIGF